MTPLTTRVEGAGPDEQRELLAQRVAAGKIKALSIKQPYPHHIFHDGKDVENRDWPTKGRGWVCSTFGELIGGKHSPFTHWLPLPTPPAQGEGEHGPVQRCNQQRTITHEIHSSHSVASFQHASVRAKLPSRSRYHRI